MQIEPQAATRVTTIARNALSPLLEELIEQLQAEGRSTEHACFRRIKVRLDRARDDTVLEASLTALAGTDAVGFQHSAESQALLLRLIEKAGSLAATLADNPDALH